MNFFFCFFWVCDFYLGVIQYFGGVLQCFQYLGGYDVYDSFEDYS